MPKKKTIPAEEPMQPDGLPEQPETGAEDFPPPMDAPLELPQGEPPQDGDAPNGGAFGGDVPKEDIPALPDDTGLPEGDGDNLPEVVDVEVPLPAELPAALPMDEPPVEPQEPEPAGGAPA